MKSFEIAFWIAALAGATLVYQIHSIHGQYAEAEALRVETNNNQNPGAGTYLKAIFDGATFGAYAENGPFTEALKSERESDQLKAQWADLESRYDSSVWYRNLGLIVLLAASAYGYFLKTKGSTSFATSDHSSRTSRDAVVTVASKPVTELAYQDENIVDAQIIVTCNRCGQKLRTTPKNSRIKLRCGNCKEEFYYPS